MDEAAEERLAQLGMRPGTYRVRPASRLEQYIAGRLTQAWRDVPVFPLSLPVHVDALLACRQERIAGGARFTLNDMVVKAAAVALMSVPQVNRGYTEDGVVSHEHADVAVAVAADSGLITPIVRGADLKTVEAIAEEVRDLADRARRQKLLPDEYTGGSFTVSNLGMFGVTSFASIINPPQGAILSVGAAETRLEQIDGQVVGRRVMMVTLTCDHRVIDGATGARWLQQFKAAIEAPDRLWDRPEAAAGPSGT